MDEYLDEFQDLITEAGYSDPKTIVVKFCRGLDTQIQNAIATMPSGRPSNMVPMDWYTAARTIDQNQATNEAFRSSYQLRVLLRLHPVRPPLTPFDFRLRSGARTINTLRPPETLFQWILMPVGKHSRSHSRAIDAERQDTRHPTVLPDSTSES